MLGGCLLLLAALLAGCAQASAPPARATATSAITAAPTATMTPLPAASLQWRAAAMPAHAASASFYVAPSDGAVAYACLAPASDQSSDPIERPLVWLTRDHAQSWSQMASIPADHENNGCILHIDQRNPAIVVALLTWMPRGAGGGPDIRDSTNYVSFNSGASWRKLTDAQPFEMGRTATVNGTTYAMRAVLGGDAVHDGLWVSHDAMSSWSLIDPPGQTSDAATFWLSPFSDALLAQYGEPEEVASLWSSPDGGAHWSQLILPDLYAFAAYSVGYLAMTPGPGKPWTICSDTIAVSGSPTGGDPLVCSRDAGKTWSRLPALTQTTSSATDGSQSTTGAINVAADAAAANQTIGRVSALASDGALLALAPGGLYRLTPGAQQWQSLGATPAGSTLASASLYYMTYSGETFWEDQLGAPSVTSPYR